MGMGMFACIGGGVRPQNPTSDSRGQGCGGGDKPFPWEGAIELSTKNTALEPIFGLYKDFKTNLETYDSAYDALNMTLNPAATIATNTAEAVTGTGNRPGRMGQELSTGRRALSGVSAVAEAALMILPYFIKAPVPKSPLAPAEAELGADLVSLAKMKHKPAVVVGAVDPVTGKAVAGRSYKGYCAEREAADALGVDDKAIKFTMPIRPRTGEVIPVCKECQKRFNRSQFPAGTPFR
jgi:hypothetical protein